MEKQKTMAREASKKASGMITLGDITDFTNESKFIGYDTLECDATVIFSGDNSGNETEVFSEGILIFDKTPFYATSGGQQGDIGFIENNDFKAEVLSTIKAPNGQHASYVRVLGGVVKKGDVLTLKVDKEYRFTTCQNHSATHLLQKSLQEVLGSDVHQKGSFVDNERLRFDFNYEGKIKDEDIIKIEDKVNEKIKACYPSDITITDIESAKELGAMALFTDKYEDNVRVVKFGDSIELCGGTHVTNTGNIRSFAIKSVESKGLNIFRIEAVCDTNLETELFSIIKPYNDEMILLLKKAKGIVGEALKEGIELDLNINISNERPRCYKDLLENKLEVETLRKQIVDLERMYSKEKEKVLLSKLDDYINQKKKGKYGEVLILEFDNYDINLLKTYASTLLNKLSNGIVLIINKKSDSVNFICKSSENLKDDINVGLLIKDVSIICEGNGGGSKTFAQGGGNDLDKLDIAKGYIDDKLFEE